LLYATSVVLLLLIMPVYEEQSVGDFELQSCRSAELVGRLEEYPGLYDRYYDQLMSDSTISSALWSIINSKDITQQAEIERARANQILGWDQRGC
jgi:hypothetical protein